MLSVVDMLLLIGDKSNWQ